MVIHPTMVILIRDKSLVVGSCVFAVNGPFTHVFKTMVHISGQYVMKFIRWSVWSSINQLVPHSGLRSLKISTDGIVAQKNLTSAGHQWHQRRNFYSGDLCRSSTLDNGQQLCTRPLGSFFVARWDGNRWEQMEGYISSTRTQYPHSYTDCPVQLSHLDISRRTETPPFNESIPALPRVLDLVCEVKEIAIKAMERSDFEADQRFAKVHDNRASKKAGCRNVLAIFAWMQTNYGDNGQRLDHFNDCPQSNAQGRHDQRSESRQVTESGRLRFWAPTFGAQTDRF